MSEDLEALADERKRTKAEAEEAHRAFLNGVAGALGRGDDVNVRALSRRAGAAHGTVYNELARRQERADQLSSNGDVPAPAPHDDDRDAALEPTLKLSEAQRRALAILRDGGPGGKPGSSYDLAVAFTGRWSATVDALRKRGLVEAKSLDLSRLGRELVERQSITTGKGGGTP